MEFIVKSEQPEKIKSACLLVGIHEPGRFSHTADRVDKASDGFLKNLCKRGDITGKSGQILMIPQVEGIRAERVLIAGLGHDKALTDQQFRDLINKVIMAVKDSGANELMMVLTDIPVIDRDIIWRIRQAIQTTYATLYRFDEFKSKKDKTPLPLKRIIFLVSSKKEVLGAQRACEEGAAIGRAMELTKNLANVPPNICTPIYLANVAKQMAKKQQSKISTAVLDEKEMAALGMGSLLSVGQGSINPPRLITMEYRGSRKDVKPIVLVGKGITFDTGGNSLKPGPNQIGMKFDMCGAATIFGVMQAASELELPLRIIGVIASAENMPGAKATRPDDVVTSMSGTTIEILNTDAEGRLVLADALTYSERFNPSVVIDLATLTGACHMIFGNQSSALVSNHQGLADDLLTASRKSGDRTWQLPLWPEYHEVLKSEVADLSNIAPYDAGAGTIVAGSFLSKFAQKFHWAHLDIASIAAQFTGPKRQPSGRPVPLLVQYLLDCVNRL